jgi:hypothetical protein
VSYYTYKVGWSAIYRTYSAFISIVVFGERPKKTGGDVCPAKAGVFSRDETDPPGEESEPGS